MFGSKVYAKFGKYVSGGTAIRILSEDGEPFATATINVPGVKLKSDEVVIKTYSENVMVLDLLVEGGIVEVTGNEVEVGYNKCPIVRILDKK